MSEEVLLQLNAKEMCVRSGLRSKWQPLGDIGSGPVDVKVTKRSAEAFFLLVIALAEDEVDEHRIYYSSDQSDYLLCCKITESLDYSVADRTFHYFGVDATTAYGLRFHTPDDALDFSNKIIEIKTGLAKASRKREKTARRQRKVNRIEKIVEEAEPQPPINDRIAPVVLPASTTPITSEIYVASAPYVQFYPGDPVTIEETEEALVKAKVEAEKRKAELSVPHPYATIDEQEEDETSNTRCPDNDSTGGYSILVPAPSRSPNPRHPGSCDAVVTTQPLRETVACPSSNLPTAVQRANAGRAPLTKPRPVDTQPQAHRKLARQQPRSVAPATEQCNKQQLEQDRLWITRQENELQYYEQKKELERRLREEERKRLKDTPKPEPVILHVSPLPHVGEETKARRESPSSSPTQDKSKQRKVSSLSEIGVLFNEESRRDRSNQDPSLEKESPITAEPLKSIGGRQLVCQHCGESYYDDSNRTGDCDEAPSNCKSLINVVSCLCLASCLTYHCASDQENETVFPFQCSSEQDDDPECHTRWAVLCAAGVCCPCLFCYWPLRLCMNYGEALHICGAAHEPPT